MVKIYKIFVNTLFILLIAVLGIYVFFRFTNKVEIFSVKTGSMEDNIHVGDYVLIYKKNDYNVGDVVTYHKDNYFITHRIIRTENNYFITKGDANNTEDEKIDKSVIVGKVIISGGILNIIVNYKFSIAAIFLALYLISCYFGKDEEDKKIDNDFLEDKTDDIETENNDLKISENEDIKEQETTIENNELKETEITDESTNKESDEIQEKSTVIEEEPKKENEINKEQEEIKIIEENLAEDKVIEESIENKENIVESKEETIVPTKKKTTRKKKNNS